MKLIIAVVLLSLSILCSFIGVSAVSEADANKYHEACLKEITLTPDEIKLITEKKVFQKNAALPSKNVQCAILCWYKKAGFVNSDNKANVDEIISYVNIRIKDEAKVRAAIAECRNVNGADMCETIFKLEKCIHDHVD